MIIKLLIIAILLGLIFYNDSRPLSSKPGEKIRKYHRYDNSKSAFISARWVEKQNRANVSTILWLLLLGALCIPT